MTKSKFWIAALCLGVTTFLGGQRLWAAEIEKAQWEELKAQRKAEGWTPIAAGVFERRRGATKVEHLAYGRKGLAWQVGELNRRFKDLTLEYENYPSDELGDTIDNMKIKIANLRRDLRNLPEGTQSLSEAVTDGPSCSSVCYSATADAYELTSSQGVGAIADAKFNNACGYVGSAYAYAYARATNASGTLNAKTIEDPNPGLPTTESTSEVRHAEATALGLTDCKSEAYAFVKSSETQLDIYYSTHDENYNCPAPPLPDVTIGGPASMAISGTECKTVTWNPTVTGGTTPYTYAWMLNGAAAGSGSSLSKQYCGDNTDHTSTENVGLTVNGAASNTYTTTINYSKPKATGVTIGGTNSLAISGTECKTATWTTTVAGGTSPYTYAWTLNGAAAGSGSSMSKQYCGNNTSSSSTQNVAVTVDGVVSDTHTATITYSQNPTAVTISGTNSLSIVGTECKTANWNTTVTGGSAPYTYAWTLNGAASGSGSSLSKQYCGNNTSSSSTQTLGVTVNGVVSDTHTATITYSPTPPSCTVTIGGPTSAAISGTTCQNLTWTSTVSCGSPVTYAWKINGVTNGTSTSTSVTKQYCGTNTDSTQTVNVSLTATGAASATDTHATTINYTSTTVGGGGGCNSVSKEGITTLPCN